MHIRPTVISGFCLVLSSIFFAVSFVNAKKVGTKLKEKEYNKIGLYILIFAIAAFLDGIFSEFAFLI
ncbi:hypothetical protein [Lagierella sp.]|uniref:hypothetical protein n=1 Tax=Lagierella sp. TaxID=2849657 RepID=UPI0026287A7A|nr:hypothetical protein [Lagierella sp.]